MIDAYLWLAYISAKNNDLHRAIDHAKWAKWHSDSKHNNSCALLAMLYLKAGDIDASIKEF